MKSSSRRLQQSGLGTSRSSNISEQDVGMLNSSIHTTTTGTAPFSEVEEDTQTINQTFETTKRDDDNIKDLYNWNATDDHERRSLPVFRDQKEVSTSTLKYITMYDSMENKFQQCWSSN